VVVNFLVARFIHHAELLQKPTSIVCHVCGACWPSSTKQERLEAHVRDHHPLEWDYFRGWQKDVLELDKIYLLQDPH
jgi:hypothetical protein